MRGECGSKIEECDTCSCNNGGDNACDGDGGDGDALIMVVMDMVILILTPWQCSW